MATTKQKRALAKMMENGGNASKAMRAAGYSDAMARNPHKLTNSQGFQKLMELMGVTDEMLMGVMKEGLKQPDIPCGTNISRRRFESRALVGTTRRRPTSTLWTS